MFSVRSDYPLPMAVGIGEFWIPNGDAGVDATVRKMYDLIMDGAQNARVQAVAGAIKDDAQSQSSDVYAPVQALREWVASHFEFLFDPERAELLYDPDAQLRIIEKYGTMRADCDDAAILYGALGAAMGCPVRVLCVGFLDNDAPFTHTWAEVKPPFEGTGWIEGDVTRQAQQIPLEQISRVLAWEILP